MRLRTLNVGVVLIILFLLAVPSVGFTTLHILEKGLQGCPNTLC